MYVYVSPSFYGCIYTLYYAEIFFIEMYVIIL